MTCDECAASSPRAVAGQATVELVALLPLIAVVALGVLQLLAAGAASELAGHAAEAGAVALLEGRDPAAAAREAVPGWSHAHATVQVRGTRVRVHVRPLSLVAALGDELAATAEADAGPAP